MSRVMIAGALALFLGGCAPVAGGGGLVGTTWQLESIRGTPAPVEAWIAFQSATRAGGQTGCNSFGTDYDRDGSALRFETVEVTEMACQEPAMQQEAAFIDMLLDTRRVTVSPSTLTMMEEAGPVTATFTRRAQ